MWQWTGFGGDGSESDRRQGGVFVQPTERRRRRFCLGVSCDSMVPLLGLGRRLVTSLWNFSQRAVPSVRGPDHTRKASTQGAEAPDGAAVEQARPPAAAACSFRRCHSGGKTASARLWPWVARMALGSAWRWPFLERWLLRGAECAARAVADALLFTPARRPLFASMLLWCRLQSEPTPSTGCWRRRSSTSSRRARNSFTRRRTRTRPRPRTSTRRSCWCCSTSATQATWASGFATSRLAPTCSSPRCVH